MNDKVDVNFSVVMTNIKARDLFRLRNHLLESPIDGNELYDVLMSRLNSQCLAAVLDGKGCFDSPPF